MAIYAIMIDVHHAMQYARGHDQVLAILIAAGTDSDIPDNGEFTPLDTAILHFRAKVIDVLLANGATRTTKPLQGEK